MPVIRDLLILNYQTYKGMSINVRVILMNTYFGNVHGSLGNGYKRIFFFYLHERNFYQQASSDEKMHGKIQ